MKRKKGNFIKNKKGNIFDLPVILVILLVIAAFILIQTFVFDKVQKEFGLSPVFNNSNKDITTNVTTAVFSNTRAGYLSFDRFFLYAFVAVSLFTIISAYFINTHPVFFIFGVLMIILVISFAAVISNVYNDLENADNDITVVARLFPVMSYIMNNLPWMILLIGFFVLIALFMKPGVGV